MTAPGVLKFENQIQMLRWMPQVLKRILHLKQMENLYEKQMNTPSNPKYHLLDQSKMRKTLNDTQCG